MYGIASSFVKLISFFSLTNDDNTCLLYTSNVGSDERILSLTDGGENYSRWESSAIIAATMPSIFSLDLALVTLILPAGSVSITDVYKRQDSAYS